MKALFFGTSHADINIRPIDKLDPSVDSTFVDDIRLTTGGNGMSASIIASRLGTEASLVTYIGDENDTFSNYIYNTMKENGVNTQFVYRMPGQSCGIAVCMISETASRFFILKMGAEEFLKLDDVVVANLDKYDVVSIHGTYQMPSFDGEGTEKLLNEAKLLGKTTVMDVTPSGKGDWISSIQGALNHCDYFLPSILEAKSMAHGIDNVEEIAKFLHSRGPKNIVIKMGDKGCYYYNEEESGIVPAYNITAIDTTGAGDCFCAAFVSTLEYDMTLRERLEFSSAVGALSCMSMGAISGIKSRQQVLDFMEMHKTDLSD